MKLLRAVFGVGLLAWLLALLRRRFTLVEDLRWEDVSKPGRLVDIDGYRVHVVERGQGPALLLIHGFGAQTYSFRAVTPLLSKDFRCIAVDLKGYGYSERTTKTDLSRTGQVRMLRKLLDELGVKSAVVLGHSMGGGIAQRFAATHPEMTRALIIAASVLGDEHAPTWAMPRWLFRPLMPLMAKLTASRLIQLAYEDRSVLTPEVRAEYLRPAHIVGSRDGLMAGMHATSADPKFDRRRLTMPILLLEGECDRVIRRRVTNELSRRLPQAKRVVVEGAGHQLFEERPTECVEAIRRFLATTGVYERDSTAVPAAL